MTRRPRRRGLVILAVVGMALSGAASAGAKVRSVAGDGVVEGGPGPRRVAPCTLRAPARVRVAIGGQAFRAEVVIPRRVAAHGRRGRPGQARRPGAEQARRGDRPGDGLGSSSTPPSGG